VNRVERALGLTLPLLQAGMGGVAGPALCAAVSRAGAGGVLGLYKEPPERVHALVTAAAELTDRPFGINIIPEVAGHALALAQARAAIAALPSRGFATFFGLPDAETARTVTDAGRALVVQVGTEPAAARALLLGAGAVVLQGVEAGGHHLGTSPVAALLAEVRAWHPDAVLVAAGGIATGSDLARVLAAGADGAMAGTLFVPAAESDAHPLFKRRVVASRASDTVVTGLFDIGWPGRPHRVLRNSLTARRSRLEPHFIARTTAGGRELPVARYSAAVPSARTSGRIEEMAMYCGCSCERVTCAHPVASLLTRFRQEYARAARRGSLAKDREWTTS